MEGLSAIREQLLKDLSLETDAEKRIKLYEELVSIVLAENADNVKTIKELGEQLMESKISGTSFSYLNQNDFQYLILKFLVSPPLPPPLLTSGIKVLFKRSTLSASKIANKQGGYYDLFSNVCTDGSFIPIKRIRKLVHKTEVNNSKVIVLSWELSQLFNSTETFRSIDNGSETTVLEPNLQITLQTLLRIAGNDKLYYVRESFSCGKFLASATNPEPCIACSFTNLKAHIPLVASEVKGEEASARVSQPQLISIAGGAAINLRLLGLPLEDSCVPAISLTGAGFQFYAVYLMKDTFPVLTAISPTFDPVSETLSIATWLLKIVEFAGETLSLLSALKEPRIPTPIGNETILDISSYFFKPIRSVWHKGLQISTRVEISVSSSSSASEEDSEVVKSSETSINHSKFSSSSNLRTHVYRIMNIYYRLSEIQDSEIFFLFPTGVVTVPAEDIPENKEFRSALVSAVCDTYFADMASCMTHRPLIAFDFLSQYNGWRNDRPSSAYTDSYLNNISKAIDIMNSAGVAHLDLRPSNIMWRPLGSNKPNDVEVKIIDFEDGAIFGSLVPPPFVEHVVTATDTRYPFDKSSKGQDQVVCENHNNFFFFVIKGWLSLSREEYDFDNFMMMTDDGLSLHKSTMTQLTTLQRADSTAST